MKQKECLLAGLLLLPLTAMAALETSDLRVESSRSPLGIDTQTHGIVSATYGMTETQVIMGSGDYDLMLGEGNVITAADGEIFWLPEHEVDELTPDNFQFEAGTVYDMCGIPIYRKYPNRVYIAKGKKYVSH